VTGMTQLLVSFLFSSLVMSAVALVILLLNALLPKASPAKLRYFIWLIVLIGLIIPFRPSLGGGFIAVPLLTAGQARAAAGDSVMVVASGSIHGMDAGVENVGAAVDIPADTAAGWPVSPLEIGLLAWGVTAVSIFTWHIWRYLRYIRTVRRWGVEATDDGVKSVFRSVMDEFGVDYSKIELMLCGFISSSMLTGFTRPVILLPDRHFDADELRIIFRHEMIHYKRRDMLIKLLSVIAVSVHWFNPIIYWVCSAAQSDGEASCDEAVLADTNSADRQFYAEVIMAMIDGGNRPGTMLSTCFYGGRSSIKKRLDSIMDTSRKMKKTAVAALLTVVGLTLLSGSVFALAAWEPAGAEAPNKISEKAPGSSGITEALAKEIALATVGGGGITVCALNDNGNMYHIEVLYGDKKYYMEVDADGIVSDYRLELIEALIIPDSSSAGPARPGTARGEPPAKSGATEQSDASPGNGIRAGRYTTQGDGSPAGGNALPGTGNPTGVYASDGTAPSGAGDLSLPYTPGAATPSPQPAPSPDRTPPPDTAQPNVPAAMQPNVSAGALSNASAAPNRRIPGRPRLWM